VAEVLFNKFIFILFFLYLQVEFFFFTCYTPVIFVSRLLRIVKNNYVQPSLVQSGTNTFYFVIFFIVLFFFKFESFHIFPIMALTCVFLYKTSQMLDKNSTSVSSTSNIYFILPAFIIFLFLLFFVKSFLTLFFFIELYSVLYYFCFLTSYNFTNQTILKYKNGLLLLLWNNFLTTFFLAFACFLFLKNSGSTDFVELTYLSHSEIATYFFLIGLFWKLGLPLFHFFKLEVYKYLLRENVFLFSILTTLINVILLYFVFTTPVVFSVVYNNNLLLISVIFTIFLAIVNLQLTNFLQFFALSGVFTVATVLSVFLI